MRLEVLRQVADCDGARAALERRARSRSPTRTLPAVGVSMPASTFSSVDLPAPLGPMTATELAGPSDSDRPSSSVAPPRLRNRSSAAMLVMCAACGRDSRTKNGPPATAVTSPRGISEGGSAERAIASAMVTIDSADQRGSRQQWTMHRPDQPARDMRRGKAHERDQAAEGDGGRHHDGARQHGERDEAIDIETEARSPWSRRGPSTSSPRANSSVRPRHAAEDRREQAEHRPGRVSARRRAPSSARSAGSPSRPTAPAWEGAQRSQHRGDGDAGQQHAGGIDGAGNAGDADDQHGGAPRAGKGQHGQEQRLRQPRAGRAARPWRPAPLRRPTRAGRAPPADCEIRPGKPRRRVRAAHRREPRRARAASAIRPAGGCAGCLSPASARARSSGLAHS